MERSVQDTVNKGEKESEKEKEGENKRENEFKLEKETEYECTKGSGEKAPPMSEEFLRFWGSYPCQIGREEAWRAWQEIPDTTPIPEALERWKGSPRWQEHGGRYVPRAAKFLREAHWRCPPAPESCKNGVKFGPRHLDEDEKAAIRRIMEADDGL